MCDQPPKLFLIDASPYIFRAFFSLPGSITTPEGEPANAIYGFAGFLLKLLHEERPSHLIAAFDGSLTTSFRNDLFPEYKAQRELPPPELERQQESCREVAAALGATVLVDDRFEADDLIASALRQAPPTLRSNATIVTSDKDLAQLIGEFRSLYDYARGERFDRTGVEERFGIGPELIPDYLALAGDSVDNIPGVRGIGKKTAVALLREVGNLDQIYTDLGRIDALPLRGATGIRRRLEEQREMAFLSRRLAVVRDDALAELALDETRFQGLDAERWSTLCDRLGFSQLRGRAQQLALL